MKKLENGKEQIYYVGDDVHYDKLFSDEISEEGKVYSKKDNKISSGSITIN